MARSSISTQIESDLALDNKRPKLRVERARKKIWIDLDNSPHVPFFAPIIGELEHRGFSVVVTARDCFQVCGLADLLQLHYCSIGRHYGKNTLLKFLGLGIRSLQMAPKALRERPVLAISHGSRSQLITSWVLGIPTITIGDYEFSKLFIGIRPSWLIVPQVIPDDAVKEFRSPILKYPGIKEDVYTAKFKPDPSIIDDLKLSGARIIVTVRPPATEAHYHVPQSDELFNQVLDYLGEVPDIKVVLLPRNQRQGAALREMKPSLFNSGKVMIPDHVVDGLNLVWHSDLVISGGGTMNREAAALGVPVYSVFRGKIGAVDRYLCSSGRLILLQSRDEVRSKIVLRRRDRSEQAADHGNAALKKIVEYIVDIAEGKC